MSSHIPTRETLKNTKAFPWQTATWVLISAIIFLVGIYLMRVDKTDETCEQRVASLQRVNQRKDSVIYDWQNKYINLSNELLYKNGIIDRQAQALQKTDSVARKKFEKPAKQIVKQNE